MKVTIELIKEHTINNVSKPPGTKLEVEEGTAKAWARKGISRQVKETKPAEQPKPADQTVKAA